MAERELVWEMRRIVGVVSAKLLASLQKVQPGTVAIQYQFGHPLEIRNTITDIGKGDRRAEKWPLISLYRPYPQVIGGGDYDTVTLTMLIANYTDPNKKSRDRQTDNFEPILLPIYQELMRQIKLSQFFVVMNPHTDMPHTMLQHDAFGKKDIADKEKVLNDYCDCIEIRDLKLKLAYKNCV